MKTIKLLLPLDRYRSLLTVLHEQNYLAKNIKIIEAEKKKDYIETIISIDETYLSDLFTLGMFVQLECLIPEKK